jgi:hypothetical protein
VARVKADPVENGEIDGDLAWRWHGNLIYSIRFDLGEPENQEWRSNLVLDIDFIAEWLREPFGEFRFCVAPATLTFHDVGDLSYRSIRVTVEGKKCHVRVFDLQCRSDTSRSRLRLLALDHRSEYAGRWKDWILCKRVYASAARSTSDGPPTTSSAQCASR